MIWFTDIAGKDSEGREIIFQFYDRELPENINFGKKAVANKIQFPGGHQTNQIIGVYRSEVEWSGIMFGLYNENGQTYNAQQRANMLQDLVGRILRVGFPVPGHGEVPGQTTNGITAGPKRLDIGYHGGFKGVYLVEEVNINVRNYLNVEYTIKLVPHERQEKIRPEKTTDVRVKVVKSNLNTTGLATAVNSTKSPTVTNSAPKVVSNNTNTTNAMQSGPQPRPSVQRNIKQVDGK